ncbi:MAG: MotA/TolQ/ExbB proton channel family protein [Betaproteobacteria bacterium]|nr:MotA/TolQ/ExbB proton channel family protein [Betaproteobacteria bacterium]NBY05861.1 MotA/TolQ/ExbB proton channel family protein [Betaproteobacteria bacterium]
MISIIQAAGWPIWPLIICSILALALVLERFYSLHDQRIVPADLLDAAIKASRHQLPTEESIKNLALHSLLGQVLASGLQQLRLQPHSSQEELSESIELAGKQAAHELEKYLVTLATIASAAPLLGLLGTVVGMIDIFAAQTPGSGNPAQLAQGISMALYNTAFGLMVAIPTLFFWRFFRAKVDAYVVALEVAAQRWVRHLYQLRTSLR